VKLYGSLTSPFVRAVRIAAIELALDKDIEFALTVVRPTEPNRPYGANVNPLRRVPALETAPGEAIVESRVIVEYLNDLANGALIPPAGRERIACMSRHAVVSGATESLVSAMYEIRLRPESKRWPEWCADQIDKAQSALDWAEARGSDFEAAFDLSAIGLVCLLGYADLRFPEVKALFGHANLNAFYGRALMRKSVADTKPPVQ